VATGAAAEENRAQASRELDFYDLKGALEAAADAMKLGPLHFEKANIKHLREGQAAAVTVGDGSIIGSAGRLSEDIAAPYKFRQPIYLAELDLSALLASEERLTLYRPLARYPSVVRDVTLLVERRVTLADLLQCVVDQKIESCRDAKLVGVYQGPNIGKRSITLRLEYRSDERTLRDDEVEELHRHIVDVLAQKFNAELH